MLDPCRAVSPRNPSEESLREARRRLVDEYAPLVRRVARRLSRRLPSCMDGVEEVDLISAGVVGLLNAASRFDPGAGSFETFAEFRVKGAMLDELRRRDFFPRRLRYRSNQLAHVGQALRTSLGREPSEGELAAALSVSVRQLEALRRAVAPYRFVALDDIAISAPPDAQPESQAGEVERRALLVEAIRHLPERERCVLELYYYREQPLREIALQLGVTIGRVSQIKQAAVDRLKERLAPALEDWESGERLAANGQP